MDEKTAWTRFVPFIIIVVIGLAIFFSPECHKIVLNKTKSVLDSNVPLFFIWFVPVVLGILYYFFVIPKEGKDDKVLFSDLGPLMSAILGPVTYAALLQTAFRFLSCLFNQLFFNESRLHGFRDFDLAILGIVMIYLFGWSLKQLYYFCIKIFKIRNTCEVKKHVSSQQNDE